MSTSRQKKISQIQHERGISKRRMYEICHSEDSPCIKSSDKGRAWWYTTDEALDKWLIRHGMVIALLILLLIPSTKASAGLITGDESLGGFSKAIDDYVARTGHGLVEEDDLHYLSAAMQLENGMNSDECLLLTGSVILNRVECPWYPNSVYEVITQRGQYAAHTVNNLDSVVVTERVRLLAIHLLLTGAKCPSDVVFQAMFPQGRFYKKVDTEYFGRYE